MKGNEMNEYEMVDVKLAYKVICGRIRKRIHASCEHPNWQSTTDIHKECQLWKELMPNIYEKANISVLQSPTWD